MPVDELQSVVCDVLVGLDLEKFLFECLVDEPFQQGFVFQCGFNVVCMNGSAVVLIGIKQFRGPVKDVAEYAVVDFFAFVVGLFYPGNVAIVESQPAAQIGT